MRCLICLFFILVILATLSTCKYETKGENITETITQTKAHPVTTITNKNCPHNIYRINILSECISNDSVGNDWYQNYKIDGNDIYDGSKISVPIDSKTVTLYAEIFEKDKITDISSKNILLDLTNTKPIVTEITVTENRGAYKGNTALWKITVSAEFLGSE